MKNQQREPRAPAGFPDSDERAVAPAVGKTLEIGFGLLVIALLTSTLYGSIVPTYRTAAGDELADRTLADVVASTEGSIPPPSVTTSATTRRSLPTTIRGSTYTITADGSVLHLDHPHPRIESTAALSVPERVLSVTGTWRSTDPFVVHVVGNRSGVAVTIGGPG